MKGYVHVYTGDGKGKTTAALGLALRAIGAGLKVYIAQFIKKGDYSEINALKRFSDCVTVEQFGRGRFTRGKPTPEDIEAARKGLMRVKEILSSRQHHIVILDEINVAVSYGISSPEDLLDIIDRKPDDIELIITGRNAAPEIVEKADLVSEVKAIKHYFQSGVKARIGIEK
ncbi:MAG: cob(I)yrinic acid a,c-diamide adenosyltransferase [Desulfobacterales bacterium]|nr:MAG: cob(I)yrinic acid a,c-diamide adenosyltransferase [Desulfobacterales bacterium]